MKSHISDKEIIELLKTQDERAIPIIFKQYYSFMCHAVYKIINDSVTVEDIVQDVYLELWRKRDKLNVNTSLKAYLRRACINKALNQIRDKKIKFTVEDAIDESKYLSFETGQIQLEKNELNGIIQESIKRLPDRCRIVFSLSRFEEMSYKEISSKLNISVKTVENQISKALKILRRDLAKYLDVKV